MKKSVILAVILLSACVLPLQARAEVNVSVGISLPPPIIFGAPPAVIVLPDTVGVYVVPDIEVDLFFWGGWWWRPWGGGWYRSSYYDRGWVYYSRVPVFYYDVDPAWRVYYRDRNWYGHRWAYERIPHQQLQRNWKTWDRERYWERQRSWGVQGYKPHPHQQKQELRRQREVQYQKRPEVQQHRQQMQERKRQDDRRGHQVQNPEQQQHRTKVHPEETGRKGERKQGKPGNKENHDGPEGGHESRDRR
jgi:hypothetical protein